MEPSVGFDYDAVDRAEAEENERKVEGETGRRFPDLEGEVLEFARRMISFIRAKDRARLTVDCLFLALGDAELENETMTSVAKKYSITKAAVSKRVKEIRQQLHLPVTPNNKSPDACKKYSRHNASPLRLPSSP